MNAMLYPEYVFSVMGDSGDFQCVDGVSSLLDDAKTIYGYHMTLEKNSNSPITFWVTSWTQDPSSFSVEELGSIVVDTAKVVKVIIEIFAFFYVNCVAVDLY